jgi:transposase
MREQQEAAMSLKESLKLGIPEATQRVAKRAFPKGNKIMRLRDELGVIYTDEQFSDLFKLWGQSACSPGQLALVLVFQHWEGLSDREAADAVRGRIDWKYALGLELEADGFDHTVLSEFRTRLIAGGRELALLDRVLELAKARQLVKERGKQRTDSTYVVAAVRDLNRVACVHETLRHALNELARYAPEWVRATVPASWYERYGEQLGSFGLKMPKTPKEQQSLGEQIGQDGEQLLEAIYAPQAPEALRVMTAIQILRRVWIQQYRHTPNHGLSWRDHDDLPPNSKLIASPHDEETRMTRHKERRWNGYAVAMTETCDAGLPNIVTHVTVVKATTPDVKVTDEIHAALARKGALPGTHYMDGGFVNADVLVNSQQTYDLKVVAPAQTDSSWQMHESTGYAASEFIIDWEARRATCPQGQTSTGWSNAKEATGEVQIRFSRTTCQPCSAKAKCTKSASRSLKLYDRIRHETLAEARKQRATPAFWADYGTRAGIEGSLSHLVHTVGTRRSRYIGQAKTNLQFIASAAARSLSSIAAWLAAFDHHAPARRRSPLAQLRLAFL